ncbi:MAG: FAD-dependent thymidylate synthase [Nitrososphaerales archaeon]
MRSEVILFSYTKNLERVCAAAMRSCYSPHSSFQLFENKEGKVLPDEKPFDDERVSNLIKKAFELGHHDVLEHGELTFDIRNVSRALTHQLVRHRLASFSQQSQRYVKITRSFGYIKPPSFKEHKVKMKFKGIDLELSFEDVIEFCKLAEEAFLNLGIKAEDTRYLRPNAATTNITTTMNPRQLLHVYSLRCAPDAQWEIRDLAWAMFSCSKLIAPTLFNTIPIVNIHKEVKERNELLNQIIAEIKPNFKKIGEGEIMEIPLDRLALEHEVKAYVVKL